MSLPIGTVSPSLAATPVAIAATAMAVRALSLKARQDNSGPVYIGDAGVTATNGYCLLPGDEVTLQFGNAMDLRRLYVSAANSRRPRGLRRGRSVWAASGGRTVSEGRTRNHTGLTPLRQPGPGRIPPNSTTSLTTILQRAGKTPERFALHS